MESEREKKQTNKQKRNARQPVDQKNAVGFSMANPSRPTTAKNKRERGHFLATGLRRQIAAIKPYGKGGHKQQQKKNPKRKTQKKTPTYPDRRRVNKTRTTLISKAARGVVGIFTGFYWVLLVFVGSILNCAGFHWPVRFFLGFSGF